LKALTPIKSKAEISEGSEKFLKRTLREHSQNFEAILEAIRGTGKEVIAIVGHEPRLGQLYTRLTGERSRPLAQGEVICLEADKFDEFLFGKGHLAFRWPFLNHGEEKLREKVHSKVEVSTFLAGFNFAVLVELLKHESTKNMNAFQITALLLFTVSLALFVAAIYMYDRLGMPEGFW